MADRFRDGFVRDEADESLLVKVASGTVLLDASDIEVGAVEIKNRDSDDRAIVSAAGAVKVSDDYQTGEILADQAGAGAVLTFTFSAAVQMVVVRSNGTALVSRADPFGGTPTASLGIRCGDDEPIYVAVVTSAVKVFAPVGTTISVYGFRRA